MAALINSIVIPQPLQGYVFARDVILCNMPVASNLQGTGNKELEPPGYLKGSKNLLNKPKLGPTLPSLTYLPNEPQSAFKLSCSSPLDSTAISLLHAYHLSPASIVLPLLIPLLFSFASLF